MYLGFEYATRAGISVSISNMAMPDSKADIVVSAEAGVKEIQDRCASGLLNNGERYNKVVDIWSHTNEKVAKAMMENLSKEEEIKRQLSKSRLSLCI